MFGMDSIVLCDRMHICNDILCEELAARCQVHITIVLLSFLNFFVNLLSVCFCLH